MASPQPPHQSLAIADARYLWSEVERLKSQVHHLQQSERRALDDQQKLRDSVASFVTQAQLDAALCTKASPAAVASSLDHVRSELLDALAQKADVDVVQSLQSKKLDISVYETSAWDFKKFRTALETSVHDLFAQFAHQFEAQISAKLSIDDFDRMFNPHTTGQRVALESAAERIARMNSQLEALQEYVHADHQRQLKIAELHASVFDLTRKHTAARNSIAQLVGAFENTKERLHVVEQDNARTGVGFEEVRTRVSEFQQTIQTDVARQQRVAETLRHEVDALARASQQTTATLAQIQQFTQHTLLKGVDTRLQQIQQTLDRALADAREQLQKLKAQTTQQLSKATERALQTMDRQSELEARVRHAEAIVASVRDDVAAVKGPLATLARNLREENVAILEEIRRSQDESRAILIDYKGLLEKDTTAYVHPVSAASSSMRPPSSLTYSAKSRPTSSTAAAVSRKHRQQQIHALTARIADAPVSNNNERPERVLPRPQTSNDRSGSSPASRIRARTTSASGAKATTASATSAAMAPAAVQPQRPQSEAGPRPRTSLLYAIAATTPGTGESDALPNGTSHDLFVLPAASPSRADRDDTSVLSVLRDSDHELAPERP